MTTINLQLKAKHFTGNFVAPCAIELAARSSFKKADTIYECVNFLVIGRQRYNHKEYSWKMFDKDTISAILSGNPETVIRTIELIPVN